MEEELEGGKMRIMKEATATETGSQSSEQTTAGMLLGLCVDTNLDIQVNKLIYCTYNFRQSNNVKIKHLLYYQHQLVPVGSHVE